MFTEPEFLTTPIFKDNRGIFAPIPLTDQWVQSNISVNDNLFTFRGMHTQIGENSQTKKVSVITGKIIDFVVDLRKETFGKVNSFILNEGQTIIVPNHFAHGFLTLKSGTIVNYLVDKPYDKQSEVCIKYSSINEVNEIIFKCMVGTLHNLTISTKDKEGISLDEFNDMLS